MEKDRLAYLIKEHTEGTILPDEKAELMAFIAVDADSLLLKEVMNRSWDENWGEIPMDDLKSARIYQAIVGDEVFNSPEGKRTIKLFTWLSAAAAIIIMILGVWLYRTAPVDRMEKSQISNNDILPGRQGATLTLANGRKISLSATASGELAREAGVVITKAANGQLIYEIKGTFQGRNSTNTLHTEKGETYQVRLPDGSIVMLNAASSLTFSANLIQQGKRMVKLEGEGYFEVAKDKAHPFVISTGRQTVEVLGTRFNLNAYLNEKSTKTTLIEGSVRINDKLVLRPGQQAVLNGADHLEVLDVDVSNFIDWKDGDFIFDNSTLEEIMNKIARWYDVTITYGQGVDKTQVFGGKVSRNKPISAVLTSIQSTGKVKFTLEGKSLAVIK